MLTHWFDNVARSVGQSVLLGALHEPRKPAEPPPKPSSVREMRSGPCVMRVSGQLVTQGFSTQASSPDGALLSYDLISTRDFEHDTMSSVSRISRNSQVVFEAQAHSTSNGQSTVRIQVKTGPDDVKQVVVSITPHSVETQIDGATFPVSRDALLGNLPQRVKALTRDSNAADAYKSDDTMDSWPRWDLGERFLGQFKDLAHRVQRDMPGCLLFPETMNVLDAQTSFPGCQDCLDRCDKSLNRCLAGISAAAAGCGPFYGVCLASLGAYCLSESADCQNGCSDGGPCCPALCERGGYGECCPPGQSCCGARCCPSGQLCADPGHDLCCAFGSGPPCGDHCCSPGFKCANVNQGFCCPQEAGDYCADEWGSPRCCPPGQVCADRESGLCCPAKHGPTCGDHCCQPGQVCLHGTCCDPQQVCGSGDNAVCCVGVCRDGVCCGAPSHMCGDVCCPPFNACCQTILSSKEGIRIRFISTCCGAFDVCTEFGCCPRELQCGRLCCAAGDYCADPAHSVCKPCQGDHYACQMMGRDGHLFSICCPAGVTCCDGKCCGPGQICCAPGGVPGCYESYQCVH